MLINEISIDIRINSRIEKDLQVKNQRSIFLFISLKNF